jgi:hypothetical protein
MVTLTPIARKATMGVNATMETKVTTATWTNMVTQTTIGDKVTMVIKVGYSALGSSLKAWVR